MQVFLPESDFRATAQSLGQKRLVKQLLEGRQILAAMAGQTKGGVNHPATRMWKGHETQLVSYLSEIAAEMGTRKYKWQDNWNVIHKTFYDNFDGGTIRYPDWWYDSRRERVIHTHRANLFIKAPELYPQYEEYSKTYRDLVCCDRCNYYWPTHEGNN